MLIPNKDRREELKKPRLVMHWMAIGFGKILIVQCPPESWKRGILNQGLSVCLSIHLFQHLMNACITVQTSHGCSLQHNLRQVSFDLLYHAWSCI